MMELLVKMDHLVHQDLQDHLDLTVSMDPQVKMDVLVLQVSRDLKGTVVIKVQQVILALLAWLERSVSEAQEVL